MIPKKLTTVLILVGFSISAFAGGWPQPKGGYFRKLSEWWVVSDQHFDRDGIIQPNLVEYGFYSTSFYVEQGLSNRLTYFFNFPFINYVYTVLPVSGFKQSAWKVGDFDLGLKYALTYQKPVAVSATLVLGIPLARHEISALQSGDHEFNQLIRIDVSNGFMIFKSNAWANLYTGYNHRSLDYADEFHYGLEAGIDIKDKISVTLRFAGVEALGNDENAPYINPQSLFSNFKEYLSFSPEIAYHISGSWGIIIGAGTAFSGKNILADPTFTIGVFQKKIP